MVAILFLFGCAGFGPGTIPRDRFDYAEAISKSWKSQMRLNMVKIRYANVPVFVDVSSVISQYVLEGEIDFRASRNNTDFIGDTQSLGEGHVYGSTHDHLHASGR